MWTGEVASRKVLSTAVRRPRHRSAMMYDNGSDSIPQMSDGSLIDHSASPNSRTQANMKTEYSGGGESRRRGRKGAAPAQVIRGGPRPAGHMHSGRATQRHRRRKA